MDNLNRLLDKANEKGCRIQLRFDPKEDEEKWEVKFYPFYHDDAHFYAYHNDLNCAAKLLLDEVSEFKKW